ncbi:N-acyl amino acid synthase, PEP-CTERM/exosortase system-associated [Nitrosomonas sp. Nm51]|uniref:PEP-CTERM/exosortase system-associated acyltransferase n=1 Tax=Nitrosomonas sp. Nm51 TaxID=133720 RepID=UPI0008B3FD2A|nr:PEP-CTERM/exosortase system-associated acyltransferase [Nitrosomonas sp. Nm51]SER75221.1 N-acyl amino acid synthase, PEP-CTERM/exosortase system-associated [Nitrosomonas sp. Nm51]
MSETYNTFKRAFNLIEANTPALRREVYQLRYQVFCLHYKYLPASSYPDGLEKDEYDQRSVHMLIQFIPTGKFVGTVRLILPDQSNPESLFPIELNTQIDPALFRFNVTTRKYTAEISRFLISPDFDRRKQNRRKPSEQNQPSNSATTAQSAANHNPVDERRKGERRNSDRRCLSIYMVLMAAVVRMSAANDIRYWLSAMDPALNRLVGFSGMRIDPIGPVVNYHGLRQPHFGEINDVLTRTYKRNYGAWEVITDRGKYAQEEITIKKL